MKPNSVFAQTLVPDTSLPVSEGRNPIMRLNPVFNPNWQPHTELIFSDAGISRDKLSDQLDTILSAMAAEDELLRHQSEDFTFEAANAEAARLRAEHVNKLLSGERPAPFCRTGHQIYADYRTHLPVLQDALEQQIAQSRPVLLELLKAILGKITVAAERMEQEESAKALKWGVPFSPSEPLRLLASAERGFQAIVKKLENNQICPTNTTRGILRDYLPASWLK